MESSLLCSPFNKSLSPGNFPSPFKNADVTPLHNKYDLSRVTNYRSILVKSSNRPRVLFRFSEQLLALYQFHLHIRIGLPISKRYKKTAEQRSLKLYPGGFAGYTHPQFQNSQEFALDSGVIFDILDNSNESNADRVFISALKCSV